MRWASQPYQGNEAKTRDRMVARDLINISRILKVNVLGDDLFTKGLESCQM